MKWWPFLDFKLIMRLLMAWLLPKLQTNLSYSQTAFMSDPQVQKRQSGDGVPSQDPLPAYSMQTGHVMLRYTSEFKFNTLFNIGLWIECDFKLRFWGSVQLFSSSFNSWNFKLPFNFCHLYGSTYTNISGYKAAKALLILFTFNFDCFMYVGDLLN